MAGERSSDYVGRGGGRRENWKRTLGEVENRDFLTGKQQTLQLSCSVIRFDTNSFRIFKFWPLFSVARVVLQCKHGMCCFPFSPSLRRWRGEQTGATHPGSYFWRCNFRANNSAGCIRGIGWFDTHGWMGMVFVAKTGVFPKSSI